MNASSNSKNDSPTMLTVEEVAADLQISQKTIYRLVDRGEFPKPVKIGGKNRVLRDDYQSYIRLLKPETLAA